MSIRQVLDDIAASAGPIGGNRLTSLASLSGDERAELAGLWPALPVDRRRTLLDTLSLLAEDNVEYDFDAVFINALGDADAEVRIGALRGLWEHTERDIIPALVALLRNDPVDSVRSEAALSLGRFVMLGEFDQARPQDVETVTAALRDTITNPAESTEVRARAIEAIGASSQPWARDLIHDAYESGHPELTASAVHAMGRSADIYWLPTVLDELRSADAEMRYEAAGAAGMIEDEEAVPILIELLDDEDDEVVEQAIRALGEIGGDEAMRALQEQRGRERFADAVQSALEEAEFGDDPLGFRG